ncbi:MAG: type I 3-dehydroquinate dehydratase [Tepidisphaeraceae bacterium]
MTRLCVPIFVHDVSQAQRDAALAAERGADMVELRIDLLTDAEAVKSLVRSVRLPAIVTCRSPDEGGKSALSDIERLALLTAAAEAGASYLDIELAAVKANAWAGPQQPRDRRSGWIYSFHDFQTRPADLTVRALELADSSADVSKLVWMARTVRDNLEAFDLMRQRHKPTIAICMGEAGLLSRILAKKFGGFLTFATLDKSAATAPGQPTLADLKSLYRWDHQRPETRVYGVIGSPIAHSLSPAIHNAGFDSIGFDGVYVPLLVEPSYESFKAFMETFLPHEGLLLSGLSVTIPHKENALRYLKEKGATIDPLAERIGAVNTIVIDRENGLALRGFSSDYAAILDSITAALSIRRDDLKDYRVAVLGAGGTGRTAVAALAHCGATVVVYNRTFDKAEALAAEFTGKSGKVVAARMEKLCDSCCQIYINTTSVGMSPNVDASPFDPTPPKLDASHLVFDSIYNPIETKLLAHARASGAKTVSGIEMFVRQAAAQFEAWTQMPAPIDLMRHVVESRLR